MFSIHQRKTPQRQNGASQPGLVTALALSLSMGACTGTIGGAANEPGGSSNGGVTGGGNGGSGPGPSVPPPPPSNAPITGVIASAPGPSSRFVRLSHQQWENTVTDLLKLTTPSGFS